MVHRLEVGGAAFDLTGIDLYTSNFTLNNLLTVSCVNMFVYMFMGVTTSIW